MKIKLQNLIGHTNEPPFHLKEVVQCLKEKEQVQVSL